MLCLIYLDCDHIILFVRLSYCLFACRIEKTMRVFSKIWRFAKVYTHEIYQPSHSRKSIPAKLNFGGRRSQSLYPRKFVSAKLSTLKVFRLNLVWVNPSNKSDLSKMPWLYCTTIIIIIHALIMIFRIQSYMRLWKTCF